MPIARFLDWKESLVANNDDTASPFICHIFYPLLCHLLHKHTRLVDICCATIEENMHIRLRRMKAVLHTCIISKGFVPSAQLSIKEKAIISPHHEQNLRQGNEQTQKYVSKKRQNLRLGAIIYVHYTSEYYQIEKVSSKSKLPFLPPSSYSLQLF